MKNPLKIFIAFVKALVTKYIDKCFKNIEEQVE